MDRTPAHVADMLQVVQELRTLAEGKPLLELVSDRVLCLAVEKLFINLGEAAEYMFDHSIYQDNLVFVPRPVWIVEGESSDPYYNFGKVIMYFDKEIYRIYWKLVHNRAGEYFYTAACGYHFVKDGETYSSVYPNLVIGVNDKTNRAALGGRYQSSFVERKWDPSYFSLRTLTRLTD